MRNLLVPVIDATLAALKASGAIKLESKPTYVVEPPKNAAHGDLSCNVAMVMAKGEGQPPRSLYTRLPERFCFTRTRVPPRMFEGDPRLEEHDVEWFSLNLV